MVDPWDPRGKASNPTLVEESLGRPEDGFHFVRRLPPTPPLVPMTQEQLEGSTRGPDLEAPWTGSLGGFESLPWGVSPLQVSPDCLRKGGMFLSLKPFALAMWEVNLPVMFSRRRWRGKGRCWDLATDSRYWLWPGPSLAFMFRKGEKDQEEPRLQNIPSSWPQVTKHNNGGFPSHLCLSDFLPSLSVLGFFFFFLIIIAPKRHLFRHFFPNRPLHELLKAQVYWISLCLYCMYICALSGEEVFHSFPRTNFCPLGGKYPTWKMHALAPLEGEGCGYSLKTEWAGRHHAMVYQDLPPRSPFS